MHKQLSLNTTRFIILTLTLVRVKKTPKSYFYRFLEDFKNIQKCSNFFCLQFKLKNFRKTVTSTFLRIHERQFLSTIFF